MAGDKALYDRLADWSRVVHVGDAEETGARVVDAWLVAGRRELNKGVVLAHGDGIRLRSDLANPLTGILASKGERGFHFSIEGETFCARQVQRGTGRVEMIRTLFRAAEHGGDLVGVTEEEVGGVDQGTVAIFGGDGKPGQGGFGEGIADRLALVGVIADSTIAGV